MEQVREIGGKGKAVRGDKEMQAHDEKAEQASKISGTINGEEGAAAKRENARNRGTHGWGV